MISLDHRHPTVIDLPSITLDELTQAASLMHRVDRKYVLARADLAAILAGLPEGSRVLTIDGSTSFGYQSRYFDTPDLESYRAAALGRQRRYKVRTRCYLDTGGAFLEVKTRTGQHSSKTRIPTLRLDELTSEGRRFTSLTLADAGLSPHGVGLLEPVLETTYQRTTVLAGTARLTVDTDLCWRDEHGRTLRRPDLVIVETKSPGGPTAVDRMLWRLAHRPQRISKYGTGLAAMSPDLPRHPWARTLRNRFA